MTTPDPAQAIAAIIAGNQQEGLAALAAALAPYLPAPEPVDDRWLNTREAAHYLGITVNALHKLTAAGEVECAQNQPGAKCFFQRSALDSYRRGETEYTGLRRVA